jgi:hypothetical protein
MTGSFDFFQWKENDMNAHVRRIFAAGILVALSAAHGAGEAVAMDEIVVYGKRDSMPLELDEASVRVDLERYRRSVSASLEGALGGETRPRVATSGDVRPRG